MIALIMLLSTASARILKRGHPCSKDYQPPNYWGMCVDGEYKYAESDPDDEFISCNSLVILVPQDVVGNKTLTIATTLKHGHIGRNLGLNEYGYYALIIGQYIDYGPDIDIAFYLDGIIVHTGSYQQNVCFLRSGTITTNDPNAVTYEGDYHNDMAGHVIIKSFNH